MYIIPPGKNSSNLSPSFISLLANDGIALAVTNKYGQGLGRSQKTNFAPRLGVAYQVSPKLVARAGFGSSTMDLRTAVFRQTLERTIRPVQLPVSTSGSRARYHYPTCGPGGTPVTATLETGFSCTPLDPLVVNASGLALRGIQFNYITPYAMSGNLTLQYQLTSSMSVQAGYVTSLARHLEVFPGANNVTGILPTTADPTKIPASQGGVPFPDFGKVPASQLRTATATTMVFRRRSKTIRGRAEFLATYTWSKVLSDAHDLLNGGSLAGYRAPDVPGFGIRGDYGLLLLIFGMSSISVAATNFPSARARDSFPTPVV